jgi:catechol-2,3-dioxygenase
MQTTLAGFILFVTDTDRLKQFYTGYFGCSVLEEIPAQWVLLKAGACELGLHKIGPEASATGGADSNTKLIFETTEELSNLVQRLKTDGILVGDIQHWENYPYAVCDGQDPEGNVFQLRQKK